MFALASWYRNYGLVGPPSPTSYLTYRSFSPTSQLAYGSVYKLVACIQAFVIKGRHVDRLLVLKFITNCKILVRSHKPM